MPRKSRLRIKGNDRGLMMLCKDVRRRWLQYGEGRKNVKNPEVCFKCGDPATEIDHIEPVGSRPRVFHDLGEYVEKMFYRPCQALCKKCHLDKTRLEREKRKKESQNDKI
jgi:hypothetical protein